MKTFLDHASRARAGVRSVRKTALCLAFALVFVAGAFAQTPGIERTVLGGKAVVMVADLVFAFPGARSTVVAVAGTDQGLGSFLGAIEPKYSEAVALDRNAGAEVYAAQKPDLVILKGSMRKSLGAALASLGIRALYLDLETPEDYRRDIEAIGREFGAEARAAELSAYYRGVLERVAAGSAKNAKAPGVLVVRQSAASAGSFEVPPKSWMQTTVARLAGGRPVWLDANPGDGWGRIGFEQIAAWNPEYLVVIDYRDDVGSAVAALRADPRFSRLACAAPGRMLGFPQDWYSWDQPDTRWGLGLLWFAKVLRPAEFADLDVVAEARSFYRLFYGFDDARFDAVVKPRLKGDYAPRK